VEVVGPVSPVVGRRLTRTITSLDPTQHRFIRVLAVERELSVAALLRAMIDRLEHDPEFREETVREAPRFLW
jgi:hypothetical protein